VVSVVAERRDGAEQVTAGANHDATVAVALTPVAPIVVDAAKASSTQATTRTPRAYFRP
jgi:hypothetical protein